MVRWYECNRCGRTLSRRWLLPPTSVSVDCACGATRRLDGPELGTAWARWSARVGCVLGAGAAFAVMTAVLPRGVSWPVYLLASLGGGAVAGLVAWGVGTLVGIILAGLRGLGPWP